MNNVEKYFDQSELAMAAYANLTNEDLNSPKNQQSLRDAGMPDAEAKNFASNYTVIDRKYDSTGLSVTLFEDKNGKQYVAIRGTQDFSDGATDIFDIALLGTTKYQFQYSSLAKDIKQWMDSRQLSSGFTVTGHSLGGFLAIGLTAQFGDSISHTYLYNSPGVGGINTGYLPLEILKALLVPATTVDASQISNLTADTWFSPISDLGTQVAPPTWIHIENQVMGVSDPALPGLNHSIRPLTDALALYNQFGQVDPNLSVGDITNILKASSGQVNNTLEFSLAAHGGVFKESEGLGCEV